MKKISFVLKDPSSNSQTAVILLYTCYDGRLKYYTGESVVPEMWPENVPKGTKSQINRITTHVEETVTDYKIKNKPLTKSLLSASLDELLHRKRKKNRSSDLFEAMTNVVDKMESGKLLTPKTKKRYAAGSIKTFRFTIDFLRKFEPGMTASSVDLDTYERFIKYCHDLDYSTNYIGSQIKNWKTLGKAVGGNPVFDDPGFVKIQEDTDHIALDETELGNLLKLKLAGKREIARDWFILDCYTGLRISDIKLLEKRNLGKKFITIANEKTDFKVVIPIHPRARIIIDKYKGFPPYISDGEINEYIKPLAKQAGIENNVLFTITKGGKRKDRYMKKWELVTCHTARRSFITNLRKNGVADTIVMKLTGIKSPATLAKYDKLTADEAGEIAAGLEFFK
jgi:integrase